MKRAAVVCPLRTPVGTFGGSLRGVPVEELGATVVARAASSAPGIDPARIEDVVFAQSYANGETPCIGRWVALQAGLPIEVPGMQLDRRCGGGLQAIVTAAMMVQTGAADVVMAGGVESMSNVEYYTTGMRWGARAGSVKLHDRLDRGRERSQPEARFGRISGMIETAENLARDYGITREAADAYALRSHQRAAAAWASGQVRRRGRAGQRAADEGRGAAHGSRRGRPCRPDARDSSPSCSPSCRTAPSPPATPASRTTRPPRAWSSPRTGWPKLGLEPLGFLHGWAAAGCEPSHMGIGPVPAVREALCAHGPGLRPTWTWSNSTRRSPARCSPCSKAWGWNDPERLNVNGSGISLGHPIGATGVRMMTTLLHEMKRRGGRYGLETMCIGGGQGMAAVFEGA